MPELAQAVATANSTGGAIAVNIGTATATDAFPVTISNDAPGKGDAMD